MNPSIPNDATVTTFPHETKKHGRGEKIIVGTVVMAKVGDLEEEIREIFSRRLGKEMTVVVQDIVGNMMYSVRFQDGLEKEM